MFVALSWCLKVWRVRCNVLLKVFSLDLRLSSLECHLSVVNYLFIPKLSISTGDIPGRKRDRAV